MKFPLQFGESVRRLLRELLEHLTRTRDADWQSKSKRFRPPGGEVIRVELNEIDPVHFLRVNLLACLEQLLGRSRQMRAILPVIVLRCLDGGLYISPEPLGIKEANMVRCLVQIVEHEITEAQTKEGPHNLFRCRHERNRLAAILQSHEQVADRLGTVGSRFKHHRLGIRGTITPVVRLEKMRTTRCAVNKARAWRVVIIRN
jgi:hypothetical protein